MILRNHWTAFIVLPVLLAAGTVVIWFLPFQDAAVQNKIIMYLIFLAVLIGFTVTAYFLQTAKEILRESVQIPALRLQVLPPSNLSGSYKHQKTNRLVLTPDETGSVLKTRCALCIENTGSRPASKIFLTFHFQRRRKTREDTISRLVVDYNREKQQHAKCTRCDVDVQDGFPLGYTLRFDESLVVYPDPNDKPVVAELDLIVKGVHFEQEFEIRYRIQSFEGNRYIHMNMDPKTGLSKDQVYFISFERDKKLEGKG